MAVGKTLMDLLGIQQKTASKPLFKGVVLTTRRNTGGGNGNRVNLFAKVPNWNVSACKSSEEILSKFGYQRDGGKKLYVSVRSRQPNSQGLYLEVDKLEGLLRERHRKTDGSFEEVAVWSLDALRSRLIDRHPASAWITANVTHREGIEYFHYRFIQFTDEPRADRLTTLLDQGTVTLDHLISTADGRTIEKGPLFKIRPNNVRALFPEGPRYDLMAI